ncbi:hypothetical protein [Herbiconiux sp.]|uniref:hypothetical protein n=1 Tax=Herbiconiux sp. TaxID=1871186 RepID=UPI0025C2F994|nr:hypothetical protein [Herbiconiux sp.]
MSALTSFIARRSGIRILLIKGLVAEELKLRPARGYADVDVLVEPARFDEFIEQLARIGWHERVHLWLFDRIDEHSMAVIHDNWPIDIDVHRYFPGFLRSPEDVFEQLWEHRQAFTIAATERTGTDAVAGAAILGLHSLRSLHYERTSREYTFLVDQLRADPETAEALAELAAQTGSSETLSPLLSAVGVPPRPGPAIDRHDLAAWRRRTAHPSRAGEWMTYFSRIPVRRWPGELRVVIWPPRELYLQDHPDAGATRAGLIRHRIRRLGRGAVGVAKALFATNGRAPRSPHE